jgi:alkylhydroperoxidase family enzyme
MAFIELIEDTGETATNYTRAFAHRPAVYAAWRQLVGAITESMDERLYELVTLAAAGSLRSSYCSLAHGRVLLERHLSPEELVTFATEPGSAPLTPVEAAAVRLARRVVEDATSVSAEDVGKLRELGLSDPEIFDIVAAAAARCFFSKTLDALGVQADAHYSELPPELREALVTGRPIAPPTGRGQVPATTG